MKIAFFGGSFNPPHKGHLQTVEFAKKTLGIDRVVFLVTPQNPFKSTKDLLPLKKRVELLKTIAQKPYMEISTMETKFRKAESINTVRLIKKLYPNDTIYFILGTDNLAHLHKWKGIIEILQTVRVVIVNRGGVNIHKIIRCNKIAMNKITTIYKKTTDISSTEIRKAITY